jgi:hypothetical protein
MINKLLDEMKEVREKKDYKNYRTLTDILTEYIAQRYFSYERTLSAKETEEFHEVFKQIILEIIKLQSISDTALQEKEYGILKIVTQSYGTLMRLNCRYQYILDKINKI